MRSLWFHAGKAAAAGVLVHHVRRLADLRESIQKAKTSAFPDTDDIAKEQKEIDRLEKQQLALLRLPCEAGEAKTPAAKKQRTR